MLRRALFIALLTLAYVAVASAQYRDTSPAGDTEGYLRGQSPIGLKVFRGLIDPSRMQMTHSVSFGYWSAGGQGGTDALYMNHMQYQIARPLWISTHLGYEFQPSGPAEWNPGTRNGDIVGGLDVNWQPTSNSLFRLSLYRGLYSRPYYGEYGWTPYDYRPHVGRP